MPFARQQKLRRTPFRFGTPKCTFWGLTFADVFFCLENGKDLLRECFSFHNPRNTVQPIPNAGNCSFFKHASAFILGKPVTRVSPPPRSCHF